MTRAPRPLLIAVMPLLALSALHGCGSAGVGAGISVPVGPISVGVGVGSGGVTLGAGTGVGPVGVGVGVNQRGVVTGGVGVGASTPIGNSGARAGVGVGTGTVLYDPQRGDASGEVRGDRGGGPATGGIPARLVVPKARVQAPPAADPGAP